MPLSWEQVAQQDEFKALSDGEQAKAKIAYFHDVIAPQLPPDKEAQIKIRADFIRHTKDVDLKVNRPNFLAEVVAPTILKAPARAVGIGLGIVNSPLAFVWGSQVAPHIDPESFDKLPIWKQALVATGSGLESAWKSISKEGEWGTLYGDYYQAVKGKTIEEDLPTSLKWTAPTLEFIANLISDPLVTTGAVSALTKLKVPVEFVGKMPQKIVDSLAKLEKAESAEKVAVQNKLLGYLKDRQNYIKWWEDRLDQFDLRPRGEPLMRDKGDTFSKMTAARNAKVGQPKREFSKVIPKGETALAEQIRTTPKLGKKGVSPEAIRATEKMNAFRKSKGMKPLDKFNQSEYDKFRREQALDKLNEFRESKGLPKILKGEEGFIDLGVLSDSGKNAWRHFKEFWTPFSTVPNNEKLLFQRYKGMGKVGQAVDIAKNVFNRLDRFPLDVRQDAFRYLDGQIPLDTIPLEAHKTILSIQERTKTIGRMLVKRGVIKQKTFDNLKGKYVHYMYSKHILGDDARVGITPTGKLDLSYAKARKNLTTAEKAALGQIEDAQIAVPTGMGKALSDIAKFDYMDTIAKNPDWTWQPGFVDVPLRDGQKPIRMSIGKLNDELKIYEKMVAESPTPEIVKRRDILKQSLGQAIEQTGNMPKGFTQLPTSNKYGPLSGAFVRTPIADDLKPIMTWSDDLPKVFKTLVSIEQHGMSLFKAAKVTVNMPTAVRNIVSNIFQNNMRGRNLANIVTKDIPQALVGMKRKDTFFREFKKLGGLKTNWSVTEINNILDEFSKVKKGNLAEVLEVAKRVSKYYGRIDDISKFSIYRQLRTSGSSQEQAIVEAMKWGMDYSLASRSIKHLRQHIVPFASYQYKIAPLIAESLAKRPWVIAKYALIPTMAAEVTKKMYDMTDKDWDHLLKELPMYIKQSGSYMIIPTKSKGGNFKWTNTEYFFPWGNQLAIFRDLKDAEIGEAVRDLGISNPFLDVFRMVASARQGDPPKNPFSGVPIWNNSDEPYEKAGKLVEALGNVWMPSMLTRHGALGTTIKAIKGGKDRWGREVTPAQAISKWFGLNILEPTPRQTKIMIKHKIKQLKTEDARIQTDPSISQKSKDRHRKRIRKMMNELRERGL